MSRIVRFSLALALAACSSAPTGNDASCSTCDAGVPLDGGPPADAGDMRSDGGPFMSPWTGTTIDAASCELADVRTALSSAADGDTISIPAGTCTWNDELVLDHGVRVLGAGIDATHLVGGRFTTATDRTFRVSGLTLSGTAGFNVVSHGHGWRIDHIRFDTVSGFAANRIVWIEPAAGGYTTGLVDHCQFVDPQSIQVHIREAGGNDSYLRPLDLGGEDAIYVEDCRFEHSVLQVSNPVTDCEGGGRIVMRHSYVANSYTEMHDAIIGGLRSCRRWETYANEFETTYPSGQCGYVGIRGGTGVVFDNTFLTMNDCAPIQIALYRTYQLGGDPWDRLCGAGSGRACFGASSMPAVCTSDADCGGAPGSCADIDGDGTSPPGYPCRDQLGTDGNAPQVSQPALFWNNHFASGELSDPDIASTAVEYVAADRDYCTSATMPASCNGITTTYTPYTYPHPLTAL